MWLYFNKSLLTKTEGGPVWPTDLNLLIPTFYNIEYFGSDISPDTW